MISLILFYPKYLSRQMNAFLVTKKGTKKQKEKKDDVTTKQIKATKYLWIEIFTL